MGDAASAGVMKAKKDRKAKCDGGADPRMPPRRRSEQSGTRGGDQLIVSAGDSESLPVSLAVNVASTQHSAALY